MQGIRVDGTTKENVINLVWFTSLNNQQRKNQRIIKGIKRATHSSRTGIIYTQKK